jgi:hypothetical protein
MERNDEINECELRVTNKIIKLQYEALLSSPSYKADPLGLAK